MPNTIRNTILSAAALVAFGTISTAYAGPLPALGDTIIVNSEPETTSDTATVTFSGLPGGEPLDVYTAPVLLSGTFGPTGVENTFTDLLAYCTDLYHYSATPATYTLKLLTASNQPTNSSGLTTGQVNEIANLIANASNADQAALQLAIWDIEYGSEFSFSGASSTVDADYAAYVNSANLDPNAPQGIIMYQLQGAAQGFVITEPVPEPMSLTLLCTGLVGLGILRRQRMT